VNNAETAGWSALIVDDDSANLEVASQFLGFLGARAQAIDNAPDALKALERITPTFILLDISMPMMDGWEMLKQVRANPETASIPIIALTAHAMSGDREAALKAGFDGYISKPFMLNNFIEEIKRVLAASRPTS
jgi:two-component system, cell cycle response regulator DivK